jgi:hypothetical protein
MGGGDWLEPQQQVQQAIVSYEPQTKTVEVKPTSEAEAKLMAYVPEWVTITGILIVGAFVIAVIIRKSGLGFLLKRIVKLWCDTAFGGKKNGGG